MRVFGSNFSPAKNENVDVGKEIKPFKKIKPLCPTDSVMESGGEDELLQTFGSLGVAVSGK